ncbi:MAG: MFS transporter [Clostridia bacterium]|nr:MFS transporter [Clostridia bacterium]
MKLNYKRTLLVGFAFFLITVFWQAYDSIIPKILTDKFGLSQFWSGIIMAFDNVLAVFMLPLFGAISDKHQGRRGRRTPFILIGTIAAAVLFVGLSFADQMQLSRIEPITGVTASEQSAEREEALTELYRSGVSWTFSVGNPNGPQKTDLANIYGTEEQFLESMREENPDLTWVTQARQAYAWQKTCENPVVLIVFIVLLLGVLISMATFRSPAVALMPDVTPKPLRSKANAIINLMGTAGGILVLILGIVFGTGKTANTLMSYTMFFMTISFIMLGALLIFMLTVKEPKWAAEALAADEKNSAETKQDNADADTESSGKLPKDQFRSLCFILASVALWFMGYNAVTSKYSVYAGEVLQLDFNLTLIVAQAAAIVSYVPVGIIASKVGRKKTILAGVLMLGIAFCSAAFMKAGSNVWVMNALFALAGIGWATINVNSYPMVVELAKAGDVGRYTGYYYTASMTAQIVTPILSGAFLTFVGMRTLFPYAAIFVALAFVTMLFVRHGDSRPVRNKDLLENLDVDD